MEFYEEILKDEPTNSLIAKRKIAVYKAQGDIGSAITELTELLEKYVIRLLVCPFIYTKDNGRF